VEPWSLRHRSGHFDDDELRLVTPLVAPRVIGAPAEVTPDSIHHTTARGRPGLRGSGLGQMSIHQVVLGNLGLPRTSGLMVELGGPASIPPLDRVRPGWCRCRPGMVPIRLDAVTIVIQANTAVQIILRKVSEPLGSALPSRSDPAAGGGFWEPGLSTSRPAVRATISEATPEPAGPYQGGSSASAIGARRSAATPKPHSASVTLTPGLPRHEPTGANGPVGPVKGDLGSHCHQKRSSVLPQAHRSVSEAMNPVKTKSWTAAKRPPRATTRRRLRGWAMRSGLSSPWQGSSEHAIGGNQAIHGRF
jgi:hypothetical protein